MGGHDFIKSMIQNGCRTSYVEDSSVELYTTD